MPLPAALGQLIIRMQNSHSGAQDGTHASSGAAIMKTMAPKPATGLPSVGQRNERARNGMRSGEARGQGCRRGGRTRR